MRNWEEFVRGRLALPELTPEREARIVRELAAQLEDFYRDALARGLSHADADAHARRQIRNWGSLAAEVRDADRPNVKTYLERLEEKAEAAAQRSNRRWNVFSDLLQDLRHALRQLRKSPGFTAVAVLTLALGIGATTSIFSVVHGVLLRPFPYPDPDRLAVISISWPGGRFWLSEREVLLLREQSTLFEGIAILDEGSTTLLGEEGEPRRLNVGLVSSNTFPLVGVQPLRGRLFTPEEEQPNGPAVFIISYELWQSRFGGDPDIIGKTLEIESTRRPRVVGVMPPGFTMLLPRHLNFHRTVDAWFPHQVDYRTINRGRNLVVIGRVKKGVTWPQAQEELDRIANGFFPAESTNTYRAFPLQADTLAQARPALLILLAATGIVLLIVCANVANLLLARGATRQRELAIRSALGASRLRMVRQSLTESGVLALCGGAAGVLLAWGANHFFSLYLPPQIPRLENIQLDGTVLAVSLAMSLLAGLFFGVAPAIRSTRVDLDTSLKEGSRGRSAGGMTPWLRSALIVGEIALSLILLVGGSLMVRSFIHLQRSPIGYNPSNLLTFTLYLPSQRYQPAARAAFFRTVQENIAGLPGVESVSGAVILPFGTSLFQTGFTFYDSADSASGEHPVRQTLTRPVLPGYFETMQTRLRAGRLFTYDDTESSERVAIIDDTLAQSVWPGQNPLGKRIARGGNPEKPTYLTVVGVVENLRIVDLTGERRHQVYLPHSQFGSGRVSFLVRARSQPEALFPAIRDMVHSMDPRLPLHEVGRLDHTVAEVMAPERLTSLLMTAFALIGLLLALVGVFGVISYAVNQQTHEIGVRLALGAQQRDIYRLVLGAGARLALLGVVLGIGGALALARTIESLLFEVSATDPWSYAVMAVVLIGAALAACYVPARRAVRVDPLVALRYE